MRRHDLHDLPAVALALLATCAAGAPAQGSPPPVAISNVTVIDGTGALPRSGLTVFIEGGRIARLTSAPPRGARVIDGTGKFLIPGLWDMHVHLILADTGTLGVFLANGVTGVREMGGDVARSAAWRRAIEDGRLVGPRLFFSGPILESGAYFESLRRREEQSPSGFFEMMRRSRIAVGSPADARAAVDSAKAMGAHFVKVRTATSRATLSAILTEARRAGIRVVGHAPNAMTPMEAAAGGQASMEHGFFPPLRDYLPAERAMIFGVLARTGTRLVPTLVSSRWSRIVPDSVSLAIIADTADRIEPRRRYASEPLVLYWKRFFDARAAETPTDWPAVWRENLADIADARAAGVTLLVGTDFGAPMVLPGSSVHEELALLVEEAKLSPLEVIAAATRSAAEFLGIADSVGTVAPGKAADLVLLDADPTADIRNVSRIAAVVSRGRFYDRAALDELLATGARAARGGVKR